MRRHHNYRKARFFGKYGTQHDIYETAPGFVTTNLYRFVVTTVEMDNGRFLAHDYHFASLSTARKFAKKFALTHGPIGSATLRYETVESYSRCTR